MTIQDVHKWYNKAMLVDEVEITIKAGDGGSGAISFLRNGQTAKGGPNGGNGGNGGDIYFQGVNDITVLSLFKFKKSITGENGINGGKDNLFGRNGKDIVVYVPVGTTITDLETGQIYEINDDTSKILLAKGGKGGRGNREFRSSTVRTPKYREYGEKGQERQLKLELKMIADIGLIGLPNAGKSSLLGLLTNATPKIGNYAFTTLEPNLGVMGSIVLADLPGLIEGASAGKGLGIKFLKHVEKTKVLVHCIDSGEENVLKAYEIVRNELTTYNPVLLEKDEIIVLTKTDLIDEKKLKQKIQALTKTKRKVVSVSIYNQSALEELQKRISQNIS